MGKSENSPAGATFRGQFFVELSDQQSARRDGQKREQPRWGDFQRTILRGIVRSTISEKRWAKARTAPLGRLSEDNSSWNCPINNQREEMGKSENSPVGATFRGQFFVELSDQQSARRD